MGGSVTLSCSVAEGVPTPEIHWDKLSPEEIALPINMEGQCHTCTHTVLIMVHDNSLDLIHLLNLRHYDIMTITSMTVHVKGYSSLVFFKWACMRYLYT